MYTWYRFWDFRLWLDRRELLKKIHIRDGLVDTELTDCKWFRRYITLVEVGHPVQPQSPNLPSWMSSEPAIRAVIQGASFSCAHQAGRIFDVQHVYPPNRPLEKEIPIGKPTIFRGKLLVAGRVSQYDFFSPKKPFNPWRFFGRSLGLDLASQFWSLAWSLELKGSGFIAVHDLQVLPESWADSMGVLGGDELAWQPRKVC